MSDDTGRCRTTSYTTSCDTDAEIEPSLISVSLRCRIYDIVWYMWTEHRRWINVFNYSDTGRHRTTSSDVVRCSAQCEHRFRLSWPLSFSVHVKLYHRISSYVYGIGIRCDCNVSYSFVWRGIWIGMNFVICIRLTVFYSCIAIYMLSRLQSNCIILSAESVLCLMLFCVT